MPALGSFAARSQFEHLKSTGESIRGGDPANAQESQHAREVVVRDTHPLWESGNQGIEVGGGAGGILPRFNNGEQKSTMAKWNAKREEPGRAWQKMLMCLSVRKENTSRKPNT
jgi:hypothetical protein